MPSYLRQFFEEIGINTIFFKQFFPPPWFSPTNAKTGKNIAYADGGGRWQEAAASRPQFLPARPVPVFAPFGALWQIFSFSVFAGYKTTSAARGRVGVSVSCFSAGARLDRRADGAGDGEIQTAARSISIRFSLCRGKGNCLAKGLLGLNLSRAHARIFILYLLFKLFFVYHFDTLRAYVSF